MRKLVDQRDEIMYAKISEMSQRVQQMSWHELMDSYVSRCAENTPKEIGSALESIQWENYHETLREALPKVFSMAREQGSKAVYFEYNPYRMWESSFFLCTDYYPESEGDEAWTTEFNEKISGPTFPRLSDVYQRASLFEDKSVGYRLALALVASTTASVGKVYEELKNENQQLFEGLPFGVAFTGQEPVFRILEKS